MRIGFLVCFFKLWLGLCFFSTELRVRTQRMTDCLAGDWGVDWTGHRVWTRLWAAQAPPRPPPPSGLKDLFPQLLGMLAADSPQRSALFRNCPDWVNLPHPTSQSPPRVACIPRLVHGGMLDQLFAPPQDDSQEPSQPPPSPPFEALLCLRQPISLWLILLTCPHPTPAVDLKDIPLESLYYVIISVHASGEPNLPQDPQKWRLQEKEQTMGTNLGQDSGLWLQWDRKGHVGSHFQSNCFIQRVKEWLWNFNGKKSYSSKNLKGHSIAITQTEEWGGRRSRSDIWVRL